MKPDPKVCKLLDDSLHVVAFFYKRSSKVLMNKLKIKAEKKGGNVLELVEVHSGSDQAIARLYKCPNEYVKSYKEKLSNFR